MPGAAGTILFVEDEAFVRDVTREVLPSAGYRILPSKNAAEAIRLCDQHCGEVDLLTLGCGSPRCDWLDTGLQAAARKPIRQGLVGYRIRRADGIERGEAEEFTAKPFSTETLLLRVRQLLDAAGPRSEKRNR